MVFLTGASIFIDGNSDTNKRHKVKESTTTDSSTVICSKSKTEAVNENV